MSHQSRIFVARAVALIAAWIFLKKLRKICRWGESLRDVVGRLVLALPVVRKQFVKQMLKDQLDQKASVRKQWQKFGEPLTRIPEVGWSKRGVKALLDEWTSITNEPLKEKHFSGTIYPNALTTLDHPTQQSGEKSAIGELANFDFSSPESLSQLSRDLQEVYTYAFERAYLWNELHGNEFGIGYYLGYQVVRMVASMFGGKPDDCAGFVTSGGTESLMLSMRIYRNWGVSHKGHNPGEAVVIACESIHAAVMKGASAYNIRLVLCRSHHDGRIDKRHLRSLVRRHGNAVVAIYVSAPSYATGVIDDVAELAKFAKDSGVGCHVDSCLGGFIVNNLDRETDFLSLEGVTTLSADTHKNGWAPKGSSVLVTRSVPDSIYGRINLAFYGAYSYPDWSGGVYGTPRDPGSQAVMPALHAFLALVMVGQTGYRAVAQGINKAACGMADVIKSVPQLKLLAPPEVNVVAWEINPEANWPSGAIYAFAHEMDHNGFALSAMKDEKVHYCVTGRLVGKSAELERFAQAVRASVAALELIVPEVKAGKRTFPGDAGLYGQLKEAMEPSTEKLTTAKYIENWLLGRRGASDAIKHYFLAHLMP